jgi:Mg2+ and Co2+ transporter CorA
MRAADPDINRFTELPNKEEAKMIILEQFNINQTELLFWLDNNTKVKHVLKEDDYYYIFFKSETEYTKLSEYLEAKVFIAA